MTWITVAEVSNVLHRDLSEDPFIEGDILRAQGLCELEIGEQAEPSAALKAVVADITARLWRSGEMARLNAPGFTGETTGPFNFQAPHAGSAGLGLTDREKRLIRKAAGIGSLGVISTTRGHDLDQMGWDDLPNWED